MLSALERPGMPHIGRWVGASAASSNSNRPSWYFSDVSDLRVPRSRVCQRQG